ncbi:hypothetical protein A2619_05865 [candidate division WWE3 bacterium RIFOXYD1_FULL_39_9]|uniref:Phage capsid-like C-terminal domain-containing protein n=1 Tax=candidate division WWE3 bacterium RIFOXYD1_FULL_39_9 TaxID=1802649 RepID=A0A1F4X3Q3_UNCKA|nr:MAG: hypothetical protein A2619_05865 [candidate division WWE3 bacterium RIFOXYD1_FULL_39_9]
MKKSQNPEVVKQVFAEIDRQNDGLKKNYETLRTDYTELKHLVGEVEKSIKGVDPLLKEQVKKFEEAIVNRQAEMDTLKAAQETASKEQQKRMDALELTLRRPNGSGDMSPEDVRKLEKSALDWQINVMSMREDGAKWHKVKGVKVDVELFKKYQQGLEAFMRSNNDLPERTMDAELYKALTVGSDPDGGYTVTPAMGNRIITRVFEADPIRQLCALESITTGAIEWMVDFGQAGFGWEGETSSGAETGTPDLKKKRIPVHVCYAKPRASQTLLEDSGINIENWLADHVAKRFARGEGASFVTGDGVGKPRGFLTYDNVTTAGTPEWGKVEQINMGHATALTADGFINVKYSMTEYYLGRGTWLMNRTTVADALQLKDGQGRYIWQPGMEMGQPGQILGLPVRMSTTMPVVAANALSVALADWQEFYMIVDRLGITIQRDPYTAKPMIEFYTRKRVGADVVNFEAGRIGVIAA